jgi:hypothetical protein
MGQITMLRIVVLFILFAQTGRLAPGTGIVTGSIQMEGGGPAGGVRVAVIPWDDTTGANLTSLAETDSAGKFRLIDIPQGRYFVIAGRLSSPTFFPGGADRTKATAIVIEAARTISNIDFRVPADSRRPNQIAAASVTLANAAEASAYQQASNEKNLFTKIKLLRDFETRYPKSTLLPRVYDDLMDLYTAKNQLDMAATYGEKWLEREPDNVWAMVQVSRSHGLSQRDLREALRYGEMAVTTVAKLKKGSFEARPPLFRDYTLEMWTTTISALESSAASNLKWVKQVVAWHQNAIDTAVRSRR